MTQIELYTNSSELWKTRACKPFVIIIPATLIQ